MWGWLVLFWAYVLVAQCQEQLVSRVVRIDQGFVRGYKERNFDIFAFYDIPYATASERFKAPTAAPTWTGIFEATQRGIRCPQGGLFSMTVMQEDCLVANVFVPNIRARNLPVLVNVHGGAFQGGDGLSEGYKNFVQSHNVIAVTFNYRLGVLGFLCLGTKDAPGNAGLKDQLALLRWVRQNIASFGGNPNDVTFAGCSAGAASVDILTLSPTTRGLFNKVISNSGAHLGVFAVQVDPVQNAKDAARMLNFTNVDNISSLEEFYKNAPVQLLSSTSFVSNRNAGLLFSPCIEKDLGDEAILLNAPFNILKRGEYVRYPTMCGFTNLEGILRIFSFDTWRHEMNERFSDFLPGDLQFESEEQREQVANTVKQFYFGDQPVSEDTILSYFDYFSDVKFVYSIMRSVKLNAEAGNSTFYLHEYTFTDENSSPIPFTNVTAAPHCAQAMTVQDYNETGITEEYRNITRIMRDLWGNFIKTGVPVVGNSPVPSWPTANANRSPHLHLGRTIEVKSMPVENRTLFWDDIYERYYRAPIPPSTGSASAIKCVCLLYFLIILYIFS